MASGRDIFAKLMLYFGFTMVAVFIGLGAALIFLPVFTYMPQNMKSIFGIFFIAYGLFRLARMFQQIRENKRKEFYNE